MEPRRALLAASLALVTVALMAPTTASAQEELWWFDHDVFAYPVPEGKKLVEPESDMSLTVKETEYGPCEKDIKLGGKFYNEFGGMGEGDLLETILAGESCETSNPSCIAEDITPIGFPWTVTLTSNKKVHISGVDIEVNLQGGCAGKQPLPLTSVVSGSIEGTFVDYVPAKEGNPSVAATFEFSGKETLTVEGMSAALDGTLKFGTKLTGLPEPEEGFTATEYIADMNGVQTTASVLNFNGRKYECSSVTFKSKQYGLMDKFSFRPEFSGCLGNPGGFPTTTKWQCEEGYAHYSTTSGETVSKCTKGFLHEIIAYTNAEHKSIVCSYQVQPIAGPGVTYENQGGTKGMKITYAITEIPYVKTAGTELLCGPASGKATYNATMIVTAKNSKGEAISYHLG